MEFLNFVKENAQMRTSSIEQLLEIVNNENLKNMLKSQYERYKFISEKANELINENSKSENNKDDIAPLKKSQTYYEKTLLNKSEDDIAVTLMHDSVDREIQITKELNRYENKIDQALVDLGKELLKIEETNLLECKKFLGVIEH